MKYIWYLTSGKEQLFNVLEDHKEQHDLSGLPQYREELAAWRARLVKELEGREEGFVEDGALVPGRPVAFGSRRALALAEQRAKEGFPQPYLGRRAPDKYEKLDYEEHLMK